jgi:hypothetical protein
MLLEILHSCNTHYGKTRWVLVEFSPNIWVCRDFCYCLFPIKRKIERSVQAQFEHRRYKADLECKFMQSEHIWSCSSMIHTIIALEVTKSICKINFLFTEEKRLSPQVEFFLKGITVKFWQKKTLGWQTFLQNILKFD